MNGRTKKWLLAIFIFTLVVRLILAFSIPNFTYDSYFNLRQVEHITNEGTPLYQDNLSYGGRELRFLPAFHYIMSFLDLFLPLELIALIIPNLLLTSLTLIVYGISKKISKNEIGSLFSAGISGFLPILFKTNNFTVDSLFLPLIFLAIYSFLNLNDKKFLFLYIISFSILSFTSSATSLLIIGFGIYLLLSTIEGKKINHAEIELILFSLFFFIWTQFLFFKNLLLNEGTNFIWQNIPSQIIIEYFPQISISSALIQVGIIPFLAGIFVVYQSLFQLKNQKSFLLISLVISTTLMAWLRFIEFELSLAFFSVILAILFASFYKWLYASLYKTKIHHLQGYLAVILLLILIPATIIPAVNASFKQEIPSQSDIEAFKWIENNTPTNTKVAALLEEGHLITYYSKRKNLMDNHFSLIQDIEKKFKDLNSLFESSFQTHALGILENNDVSYLVLTNHAQEKYNLKDFKYQTPSCFKRQYKNETRIYYVKCTLDKNE